VAFLADRNIGIKVHWSTPLHQLQGPWISEGNYLTAENWCNSVLSLPCYPGLMLSEVHFICDALEEFFGKNVQKTD
jgi:dTDP-4-amino-4,6-dideoxygalactose transaminase